MSSLTFDVVWQKIAALEGAVFQGSKGSFTYRFHRTYVVISSGNQSIPRTFFEKVFRRMEQGVLEKSPSLQGQSLIVAILSDERLRSPRPPDN